MFPLLIKMGFFVCKNIYFLIIIVGFNIQQIQPQTTTYNFFDSAIKKKMKPK